MDQTKTVKIFLFWVAMTVIAILFFSTHEIDSDEGATLNAAWQLWNGKAIYTDFYEYVAPGSALSIYWLWKLWGAPSYVVAKLFSVALWLLSAASLAGVARRLSGGRDSGALVVLVWLIVAGMMSPVINHNPHSTAVAIVVMALVLSAVGPRRSAAVIGAGVVSGVVLWFLQTKGIGIVVASLVSLWVMFRSWRVIGIFLLSVVVSTTSLFSTWSWVTLYRQLWLQPYIHEYLATSIYDPWAILASVVIIVMMARWAYHGGVKEKVLAVFQLFFLLSSGYNIDIPHVAINSAPFVLLALVRVDEWFFSRVRYGGVARMAFLWIIVATLSVRIVTNFAHANIWNHDVYGTHQYTIFEIPEIRSANHIYAGPFLPGLYFELKKPNPFYLTNQMVYCLDDCQAKTVGILQAVKPEFAFLDYALVEKYRYNVRSPVDEYIRSQYQECPWLPSGDVLVMALEACPVRSSKYPRNAIQ